MFSMRGIRSLHATLRLLRCPQKPSSATINIKQVCNLYSTSWSSLKITQPTSKVSSLYFINTSTNCYSTKPMCMSRMSREAKLNKKILSLNEVKDHLELFDSVKNSLNMVNKVTMLNSIAKITLKDNNQKRILELEQEKAKQGENSSYLELLESIASGISKLRLRELANLLWALGKIKEKNHKLVEVCEKEILLHGIERFSNVHISQIMSGCANLNLRTSELFRNIQEAFLTGHLKIEDLSNMLLCSLLVPFAKTEDESVAKWGLKSDELFELVEKEILRRGSFDLHNIDFIQMLWAFAKAEKGSEQFFCFADNKLVSLGVENLSNSSLVSIACSFAKRKITKAKVFDLVKREILGRGVHTFQSYHLSVILWSLIVLAEMRDDTLVAEINREVSLRDLKQFDRYNLCFITWLLGKAGKSADSQLFDAIEAEVFRRDTSRFTIKGVSLLMRGFLEAEKGSQEFFELLVRTLSTREFCNLSEVEICDLAGCLSSIDVETGALFDALEKEILVNVNSFNGKRLSFLKWCFWRVGKKSTFFKAV